MREGTLRVVRRRKLQIKNRHAGVPCVLTWLQNSTLLTFHFQQRCCHHWPGEEHGMAQIKLAADCNLVQQRGPHARARLLDLHGLTGRSLVTTNALTTAGSYFPNLRSEWCSLCYGGWWSIRRTLFQLTHHHHTHTHTGKQHHNAPKYLSSATTAAAAAATALHDRSSWRTKLQA